MNKNNHWKFYNHALIPTVDPHELPDVRQLKDKHIWNGSWGGTVFFARWTTDFDCGYETPFWYVIKDNYFNLKDLKAKRRYEINKGNKNFEIKRITNAADYVDALYDITVDAILQYSVKNRYSIDKKKFYDNINDWNRFIVYGAFNKKTNVLEGYARLGGNERYRNFTTLKVMSKAEKFGINAAIVNRIVEDCNGLFGNGFYINDGTRSLYHETAFQDYLEKYFGFRKAFCLLKIEYWPPFGIGVRLLYPFRKLFSSRGKWTGRIRTVLDFEEIRRECESLREAKVSKH